MSVRICSTCGESKDLNIKNFCKYYKKEGQEFTKQCRECRNAKARKRKSSAEFKYRRREHLYKKKYNISMTEYEKMLLEQENKCAICNEESDIELAADHCHITDSIRGLLCKLCNLGLGYFKDCEHRLIEAAKYLELRRASYEDASRHDVTNCDILKGLEELEKASIERAKMEEGVAKLMKESSEMGFEWD